MTMIESYLEERFEISEARNKNLRLLDCVCPFCGKEGKVYIKNQGWGVGYCQRCGEGFRMVEFVMEIEGCTSAEAFNLLKGYDIDTWVTEKKPAPEAKNQKPYFPKLVKLNKRGYDYLKGRGLSDDMIVRYKFLSCESNGLFEGKAVWSKDRVIAPIFDAAGKLISWQGRSLDPASEVKYLFSPDFRKSEYLYNAWNIKPNPDYLIVCEGIFDCIGWVRAGFKNCVATFGKAISETQAKMLRDFSPRVLFLALDYNCIPNMVDFTEDYGHYFLKTLIITMPYEKDADECTTGELLDSFKSARLPCWSDKVLAI